MCQGHNQPLVVVTSELIRADHPGWFTPRLIFVTQGFDHGGGGPLLYLTELWICPANSNRCRADYQDRVNSARISKLLRRLNHHPAFTGAGGVKQGKSWLPNQGTYAFDLFGGKGHNHSWKIPICTLSFCTGSIRKHSSAADWPLVTTKS